VLACLRGRDALELLNVQTAVYNQSMRALQVPVADGFELPIGGSLSERFTKGLVNGNALIAGFNRDDISLFLGLTLKELIPDVLGFKFVSRIDFERSVVRFFPEASESERAMVKELYSPTAFGGYKQALFALGTEGYFACPTRRVVHGVAAHSPHTYQYTFTAVLHDPLATVLGAFYTSFIPKAVHERLNKLLGAFHGSNEMVFWGQADASLSAPEHALGRRMVSHWVNFVKTASPLPVWPSSSAGDEQLVFELQGDVVRPSTLAVRCALLQRLKFVWDPLTLSGMPSGGLGGTQ